MVVLFDSDDVCIYKNNNFHQIQKKMIRKMSVAYIILHHKFFWYYITLYIETNNIVNVENLSQGVYFAKIITTNNNVYVYKFVKL